MQRGKTTDGNGSSRFEGKLKRTEKSRYNWQRVKDRPCSIEIDGEYIVFQQIFAWRWRGIFFFKEFDILVRRK